MRLLASLLTILSLVTPTLAVDPKSVPVLIRDCVTKVDKTSPPIGAAMTRSNHPCWRADPTPATSNKKKAYASTLVNGNFTLYQYNLEDIKEVNDCDMNVARTRKTLKTWTNIGKGTCIQEIGLSFDWAPAERYMGYFQYAASGSSDVIKRAASTCDDIVELPHEVHFGTAIKADFCEYERKKFVEWGNGTVSDCTHEATSKTANRTIYSEQDDCSGKRTCDSAYRFHTCVKSIELPNADLYYYWMTFGGPVKSGAAHITSHVSIFTIAATLVMAFYAQL